MGCWRAQPLLNRITTQEALHNVSSYLVAALRLADECEKWRDCLDITPRSFSFKTLLSGEFFRTDPLAAFYGHVTLAPGNEALKPSVGGDATSPRTIKGELPAMRA